MKKTRSLGLMFPSLNQEYHITSGPFVAHSNTTQEKLGITYTQTRIHTYIHTRAHTHIHTDIHTYI